MLGVSTRTALLQTHARMSAKGARARTLTSLRLPPPQSRPPRGESPCCSSEKRTAAAQQPFNNDQSIHQGWEEQRAQQQVREARGRPPAELQRHKVK